MKFSSKKAIILIITFLFCIFVKQNIIVKAENIEDLNLVITTDKQSYSEDEDIKYNVIISNNTSNEAKDITVTNVVPSELKVKDSNAKISDNKLIWNIDSIAASSKMTLSFTAKVKEKVTNPPEIKTRVENNSDTYEQANSNKNYIYLGATIIAIVLFIFLFKVYKKRKFRKHGALLLAFLLVSATVTTVKADTKKEIRKKNHKLVINDKEYINEFTVEGTVDKEKLALKADRNFGVPKLEWDKAEGVKYEIKRGETKDNINLSVDNLGKNRFVDLDSTEEQAYYYQVIAKKDGKEIDKSEPIYVEGFIDSDKDGLSDEEEKTIYKTDPNNADTDGDKLNDGEEVLVYHTNPLLKDTDGDRLSDFEEVSITGTSPLKKDTDENGVTDDLEDFDKDTINNFDEIKLGSNPNLADSDFDGLSDDKELLYGTSPINPDTDGDGFNDGNEIKYGTNPLNPDSDGNGIKDGQEVFTSKIDVTELEKDKKVAPSIEMNLKGKNVGTVTITNVGKDNPYLHKDMPGYLGAPFEFSSKEKFDEAKMTFNVDKDLLKDKNVEPAIYYFNDKTKLLELLPDQKVDASSGTITTNVKHFSTYIVLDKKAVDKVWAKEMKAPILGEKLENIKENKNLKQYRALENEENLTEQDRIDLITDSDGDGLSDYHEKKGIRVNNGFINGSESDAKLKLDPHNPDVDGDGVKDGEEVSYVDGYFLMKSDPTRADSDNDGINDNIDPEPMVYNITDRTLALAAGLSYKNLKSKVGELVGGDKELSDFKIVHGNDSGHGFFKEFSDGGLGSVAIKISRSGKKDAVIFALRGTEADEDSVHDFSADLWMGLATNSRQSNNAFDEYKKLLKEFPNAEFYLAGHSLGGRLVQNVLYKTYDSNDGTFGFFKTNFKIPTHSATFNALGYNKINHWMIKNSIINRVKDKLNNYYFKYDLVGQGFGASKVFRRLGTDIGPLIAKDEKGNPLKFEQISSFMPYSFSELHGIDLFYNEEGLKYPNNKIIY